MEAMRKRGSRTTALGAAAAILTLVIAVAVSWAPILETYYRHRLQTGGEVERIDAVEGLVRLDRPGSVPRLLDAFQSDPSEAVRKAALRALETVRLGEHEAPRVLQAVRAVLREAADRASPGAVEVAGDLAIAVTRPGPTFRVNVEFGSDVPMQMVVGVMDACNALELPDVVLDNGGESRSVSQ